MSIPLNGIVDVNVIASSATSTVSSDFSLGLIIGDSTVISTATRVVIYASLAEMVTGGFAITDPEYLAAVKYFSQSPSPSRVAIGRFDAVTPETEAAAITACRAANEDWYVACFAEDVTDANIALVAAAVEAFAIPTMFVYATDTADVLTATTPNVMDTLKDVGYNRSLGFYSTQSYFAAGITGRIGGLNSMTANSAYTLAYKSMIGFTVEALTSTQLTYLKSYNGNAYTLFAKNYSFLVQGVMASGIHVDELYFQDLAKVLIQEDVIALLSTARVVPQTEDGVTQIISAISNACNELANMGFIATGIWTGTTVKNLAAGDSVPGGYVIQADTIASQSSADRAARKAPPIYVCLKSSGAIENITIRVYINR